MLVCVSDYLTSTYKNDGGISWKVVIWRTHKVMDR
jgi:hypothetical protein